MPVSGNTAVTWDAGTASKAITGAATYKSDVMTLGADARAAIVQLKFAVTGAGTSALAIIETTIDAGTTWGAVCSGAFHTTAGITEAYVAVVRTASFSELGGSWMEFIAAATDEIYLDGILGDRIRIKLVTVGVYNATLTGRIKWDREDVS
jgi:hypothetical protein